MMVEDTSDSTSSPTSSSRVGPFFHFKRRYRCVRIVALAIFFSLREAGAEAAGGTWASTSAAPSSRFETQGQDRGDFDKTAAQENGSHLVADFFRVFPRSVPLRSLKMTNDLYVALEKDVKELLRSHTLEPDLDGDGIPDAEDEDVDGDDIPDDFDGEINWDGPDTFPHNDADRKFPQMLDVWKAMRLSRTSYKWFTNASVEELGPYKEQTKITPQLADLRDEDEEMISDFFGQDVELSADGLTMVASSIGDLRETQASYVSPDADPLSERFWVRALLVYTRENLKSSWWIERLRFDSPDELKSEDEFAHDVSLSGDGSTVVASATQKNHRDGTVNAGVVYVYTKNKKTKKSWKGNYITRRISASDAMRDDLFGFAVATNYDGNVVVVGAMGVDVHNKNDNNGAVYVFVRTERNSPSSSFKEVQKILPSHKDTNQGWFGTAVDLSDDASTLVVGADGTDIMGEDFGAAFVFTAKQDGNGQLAYDETSKLIHGDDLQPRDKEDWNGNRVSVSADGRTVLTSAYGYNGGGGAFIFVRDGPSLTSPWTQQATLVAKDREDRDSMGISADLSADGMTVVVGAPLEDTGNSHAGAAYVFKRVGNEWTQIAKLMPSDKQFGGFEFGRAATISRDGGAIAVGAGQDPFESEMWDALNEDDSSEEANFLREINEHDRSGAVYVYGLHEGDDGWIRPSRVNARDEL